MSYLHNVLTHAAYLTGAKTLYSDSISRWVNQSESLPENIGLVLTYF
jgi:hypothetical protein